VAATPLNAYPDLSGVYEVTQGDGAVRPMRALVWRTPGTHDAYTLQDENTPPNRHTGKLKEDPKPTPAPSKRFLLMATNGTALVSAQGSPVLVFPGPVFWRRL
jgi:hypothetical protein